MELGCTNHKQSGTQEAGWWYEEITSLAPLPASLGGFSLIKHLSYGGSTAAGSTQTPGKPRNDFSRREQSFAPDEGLGVITVHYRSGTLALKLYKKR